MSSIQVYAAKLIAGADRRMLVVLGLLTILAALEMLFHPLHLSQRTRYDHARQERILVQNSEGLLRQAALEKSSREKTLDSLLSLINRSLEKHELRSSAITPNNDGSMTLSFDATEYVRLMAWLHATEQQGIRIIDIGMVQTGTPGLVTVRVNVSR